MPDDALGPLDDIVGLRLRLAHGTVQRHFAENFAALDLTQKQVSVLWLVADHDGIAQTDLARRLQMDRATTMTLVHALERRGLIARRRAEGDGRRIAFGMTAAGRAALDEAQAAIAEQEAWLAARFTDAERRELIRLLALIHG